MDIGKPDMHSMEKRYFHQIIGERLTVLALVLAASTSVGQSQSLSRQVEVPNFIVVSTPELSWSDLQHLDELVSPESRLKQMIEEGCTFPEYRTGGVDSALNQSVLLTGQHSGHAWVRGSGRNTLRLEDYTLAEALRKKDYTTGAIGLWELGDPSTEGAPTSQGFEDWVGFMDLESSREKYPESLWRNATVVAFHANAGGAKAKTAEDIYMLASQNFIRVHSDLAFFLYLNLPPVSGSDDAQDRLPTLRRLDRDIGALMDSLRKYRIHEETILILIAGKGAEPLPLEGASKESDKKTLRSEPPSLYEGSLRAPAVVWWPETIEPGTQNDTVWAAWDIFPTLVELAQARAPKDLDGQSLAAVWNPEKFDSVWNTDRDFYWENHLDGFHQAILSGSWKWIHNSESKSESLFDLSQDISEMKDVSSVESEKLQEIREKSKTHRIDSYFWPPKQPQNQD
jgi:arylsulfatase A